MSRCIYEWLQRRIDLQEKLKKGPEPDIILLDINMPQMDGYETLRWLNDHYPLIRVLVVSMIEKDETIVKMLRLGVKGYLSKDVEPKELGEALKPGTSALAVIGTAQLEKLKERIGPLLKGATLLQTTVNPERQAEIRKLLESQ